MGRLLLSGLALALLAGCEPAAAPRPGAEEGAGVPARSAEAARATPAATAATAEDPHRDVSCAGCHNGGIADEGRASVPRESCTAAGCHEDGGPERVRYGTITFEHRRHGEGGDIEPSCAGCHTHPAGEAPLHASVDACALCHLSQVTSEASQDCQLCHQEPQHVTVTSAGLPVPHADLPWAEIGCVRCHYDVADPPTEVPAERCTACHDDGQAIARQGVGADLHPSHAGLTCTACHTGGSHHVNALSSAVSLVCSDCHAASHDLPLAGWPDDGRPEWAEFGTCTACHTQVHRAQQQLLLGLLPNQRARANPKFVAGLTCRSCHIPPADGARPEQPIRGQARACAACHEPEYGDVLAWWLEGTRSRLGATQAYVRGARAALGAGAPDSARALLTAAEGMLALVEEAGGQHNLELADRIFRESVSNARGAYRLAGRQPPPAPQLGSAPHLGLCSGCHYNEGPLDFRQMPPGFHTRIVEAQQGGGAGGDTATR